MFMSFREGKREEPMQTLIAYVENKPGVLNRVSSLARRLAINIDSLTVGPTENEEVARMTIVAHTDEQGAHRLEASLEKLVDVLLAENISERSVLERDLALIKVAADQKSRLRFKRHGRLGVCSISDLDFRPQTGPRKEAHGKALLR